MSTPTLPANPDKALQPTGFAHSTLGIKRILVPLLTTPRVAQAIKWVVYLSLLVNTGQYFVDDFLAWQATYNGITPTLAETLEEFTTSIDMLAWIGLIVLLELETYQLPDEAFTRWVTRFIHGGRLLCYFGIAYAAYGYTAATLGNYNVHLIEGVNNLCQLAGQDLWLQWNLADYSAITSDACAALPQDTAFYRIEGETLVFGSSVLPYIQWMGWVDVLNAVVWLIVVALIEVEVRLQSADRFASRLLGPTRLAKSFFYFVLIGNGLLWAAQGHVLYAWDAFLWIFGFWAIELNLAEWEQERLQEIEAQ